MDEETIEATAYLRIEVQVSGTPAAVRRRLKQSHDAVVKVLLDVELEGFASGEYDEKGKLMRQYSQGTLAEVRQPGHLVIKEKE